MLSSLLSRVLLWGTMHRGFPSLEAFPSTSSGFGQVCGLNCVRIPKTQVLLKVLFNSAVLPVLINFRKKKEISENQSKQTAKHKTTPDCTECSPPLGTVS